jgi:hypothetical protein
VLWQGIPRLFWIRGECVRPRLIPDFRRNIFSMMLAISLSYIYPLLYWGTFLLFLVSSELLSWKDVEFYQSLFLHLFRWLCGFCLCFC